MDPQQMDALAQRLVQNPHDEAAINAAHQAGQSDPRAYAALLERVGKETSDPTVSSHWLVEAANVWETTLSDAHSAARALTLAFEKDPGQSLAGDRLAEIYRRDGDHEAIAGLLQRKAQALAPYVSSDPNLSYQVASLFEEAGRTFAENVGDPTRAAECYRQAIQIDPQSQYAIYGIREIHKAAGQFQEAAAYFDLEQRIVTDPGRKLELYLDEAEVRRQYADHVGASEALKQALALNPSDPTQQAQLATSYLEQYRSGQPISDDDRRHGGDLFSQLAEEYPGEHGLAYSLCALELNPAHDRGVQLAIYYGEQLGRVAEVAPLAAAYAQANPNGVMADEARRVAGNAQPPAAPTPSERPHAATAPGAGRSVAQGPSLSEQQLDDLLEKAAELSKKNRRNEAAKTYRKVLDADPANEDAITYLQTYLRRTRKYGDLREILMQAADAPSAGEDERANWLKEVAGLSETQMRDIDGAIAAWKVIAAEGLDDEGPEQLKRLLEKAGRWDELSEVLQQEAEQEQDEEVQISLEKNLAKLHETKRKDPVAAGQAWARIASLSPGDEAAIDSAVELFERGDRVDLAAQVIGQHVTELDDADSRLNLFTKLGNLQQSAGDFIAAGEAYSQGASGGGGGELWKAAEDCFAHARSWEQAASAAEERAQSIEDAKEQGAVYARVAEYLSAASDPEGALLRLEQATELDPENEQYAQAYETALTEAGRRDELASSLLQRAERLQGKQFLDARVSLRKRAAQIQRQELQDVEAARESLQLVLLDGDDKEALEILANEAEAGGEPGEAADYLARLAAVSEPHERAEVMLREASLLAEQLEDLDAAADRYEAILSDVDKSNEAALVGLAALEERRENWDRCAEVLERHLKLSKDDEQRSALALRLSDLYEGPLEAPKKAMKALAVVHEIDPDDFDAVQRLASLAENTEEWAAFVNFYETLISVEGDEEEVGVMTRRIAEVLHEKLGRSDDALAKLAEVANDGDEACRDEFVELADGLGRGSVVADKLVEWFRDALPSPKRTEALHSAFERYVVAKDDVKAAGVAKELARSRSAESRIAQSLEEIAGRLKDLDALSVAHELLSQELSGQERADELVRQSEVLVEAGVPSSEAINHGEQGLASVGADSAEPLLLRLSQLATNPDVIIDIYERQVARCKSPEDKLRALARAAGIAVENKSAERARGFFDIALGGSAQPEAVEELQAIAKEADEQAGTLVLRTTLAEALANGGRGARDGGRSRSMLLHHAALMASEELRDIERAFGWLTEALVAHVSDDVLDSLESLAEASNDLPRVDAVITRTLEEVFDGPLVRKLLARRAELRQERLNNLRGAADDLKRLHDLSPGDGEVAERLAELYEQLEDYRGMVQLYEDQILRSRDQDVRVGLARKVAVLWRDKLDEPRETADAWRRVLRIRRDDAEAKEELAAAKARMLEQKREGRSSEPSAAEAPPVVAPAPVAASEPEVEGQPPADEAAPEATEPDGEPEPPAVETRAAAPEPPLAESPLAESPLAESPLAESPGVEPLVTEEQTTPEGLSDLESLAGADAGVSEATLAEEDDDAEDVDEALLEGDDDALDVGEADLEPSLPPAVEPLAAAPVATASAVPPPPSLQRGTPPPMSARPGAPPPPPTRSGRGLPPPAPPPSGGRRPPPPPSRRGAPPPPPTKASRSNGSGLAGRADTPSDATEIGPPAGMLKDD